MCGPTLTAALTPKCHVLSVFGSDDSIIKRHQATGFRLEVEVKIKDGWAEHCEKRLLLYYSVLGFNFCAPCLDFEINLAFSCLTIQIEKNHCRAVYSNNRKCASVPTTSSLSSPFSLLFQWNSQCDWWLLNCGAPAEQTAGHSYLHPSPMKNSRPQANVTSPHNIQGLIAPLCACECAYVCLLQKLS